MGMGIDHNGAPASELGVSATVLVQDMRQYIDCRERDVSDLCASVSRLIDICQRSNPGAFANGNTDSTGSIDEGEAYASAVIRDAAEILHRMEIG